MPSPSLSQRMRTLQTKLLEIRVGSGAITLPKDIKRIHLRFAPKLNGGHMGPRKFWQHELIRMKYHNPAVPMTIDRTAPQTEAATLSVHFTSPDAPQTSGSETSSPAAVTSTSIEHNIPSAAAPTERIETINMTHSTNSEIFDALIRLTKAEVLEPTAEDRKEMRELAEARTRSAKDAKLSAEVRARQKRERELLDQARGEVANLTA
nr:hypothetical protein B0A51_08993 [Rachicladosporium sp. CCFEE 5018]